MTAVSQQVIEDSLDITDRKWAEEALRKSEEFMSSLLRNSPNPILVINPDTSIKYLNHAFEKLTGFSAGDIIGIKAPYPWWTKKTKLKTAEDMRKVMYGKRESSEQLFRKKTGEYLGTRRRIGP